MGPVESGVRTTMTGWGILEPTGAWEVMAVNLAQILDALNTMYLEGKKAPTTSYQGKDDKISAVASINRELRLTMEKVEADKPAIRDEQDDIASRY